MSVNRRLIRSQRAHAQASVLGLLLAVGLATPALAQDWHWNTGSGNWATPGNWVQFAPPPVNANVFIGSMAAAENGLVSLDASPEIAALTITDGMALFTVNRSLRVNGNTVISGSNVLPSGTTRRSELRVGFTDGLSFRTDRLTIASGGRLNFSDSGGYATIQDWAAVDADSFISGNGVLSFNGSGTTLVNNGTISPGSGSGLRMQQFGGGRFDLDGSSGDGRVNLSLFNPATNTGASLRLDGAGLADSFGGRILLGPRSDLHMNLSDGWIADASSEILSSLGNAVGGPFPDNLGVIHGSAFDFAGLLRAGFASGEGREIAVQSSQVTLRPAARVDVSANSTVTMGGASTTGVLVEGGTFDVDHGGLLMFSAPTDIRGGVFSTAGNTTAEGYINFDGETQWRGNVTINGLASQSGNATVTAPTVITGTNFDMDGREGDSVWQLNSTLVVNAQRIDPAESRFDGTFNIDAGFLSRLTINLTDPDASWQMNGTMNLAGSGGLPVTRVAGSHMSVSGNLNVTAGIAEITADTTFSLGGANVSIPGGATLRMRGFTVVDANTSFAGAGTFQNGVNGSLVLGSGVSLSQVGLTNNSLLRIAQDGAGIAGVDRLILTGSSTLGVDIGGFGAGVEHDLLLVTGGAATLGGLLEVSLFNLADGSFVPGVGDEFTILTALGGVSGTFTNNPATQVGGLTYGWTIVYNPNTVVLRLESIIPAPGSLALLGLGGLVAAQRRRA